MEAIRNYVEALFAALPQREDVLRVKADMLANLEQIMSGALNDAGEKYKSYISAVQSCYDVVTQNRNELAPQVAAAHTTDSVEDLDVSADDDEE